MKKLSALILVLWIWFGDDCIAAEVEQSRHILMSDNAEIASQKVIEALRSSFPDSINQRNLKSFSFCPDNTCIEFLNSNNDPRLLEFVSIYIFYEGDYYDLERWRKLVEVKDNIKIIARILDVENCISQPRPKTNCLRKFFRKNGVKVRNLRYDEGKKYIQQVW